MCFGYKSSGLYDYHGQQRFSNIQPDHLEDESKNNSQDANLSWFKAAPDQCLITVKGNGQNRTQAGKTM